MSHESEMSELIARAKSFARSDEYGISAIQVNKRIIALEPCNVDALNRLARCHLQAGRLDTAIETFHAVLKFAPADRIAQRGLREIGEIRSAPRDGHGRTHSESTPFDEAAGGPGQSPQLRRALAGFATDPSDMVEALLHIEQKLGSRDRSWIRDMDETASKFRQYSGFTPRQSEVIVEIYRKYFSPRDG